MFCRTPVVHDLLSNHGMEGVSMTPEWKRIIKLAMMCFIVMC